MMKTTTNHRSEISESARAQLLALQARYRSLLAMLPADESDFDELDADEFDAKLVDIELIATEMMAINDA